MGSDRTYSRGIVSLFNAIGKLLIGLRYSNETLKYRVKYSYDLYRVANSGRVFGNTGKAGKQAVLNYFVIFFPSLCAG